MKNKPVFRIEHVAFWVRDLELMRDFYQDYFGGKVGALYHNPKKQFHSYFISFGTGCRLELMKAADITEDPAIAQHMGITHLAFSVGSRETVDELTKKLADDGFSIVGAPRVTGDGYYESVVLDPESNRLEITE